MPMLEDMVRWCMVWFTTGGPPHALLVHAAASSSNDALGTFLNALIFLANLAGGLVIGIAIIREFLFYLAALVRARGGPVEGREAIRLSLGRSLALALEFQLGADILGTALNPSPEDLIVLAAIAVLRTFLNFSLGREIDAEARRLGQEKGTTGQARAAADPG